MSSESQPINPARFADALRELPASTLAMKVLELRNSIAHLDYSNAELKPFAEGTTPTLDQQQQQQQQQQRRGGGGGEGGDGTTPGGDQDCIDAIAENEAVIARMQARIELIRAEVESRGLSWDEFKGKEEEEEEEEEEGEDAAAATETPAPETRINGVNGHGTGGGGGGDRHEAWRDGTFQTGTISASSDSQLLRDLLSRMPPEDGADEDPEGGMHL
ncbi:hypothetical protein GGR56DRAFT_669648 [Xylariaceae sp. FL0804]|nr:hypothetical protein GGR56DRAFT_669648 [Xylariaceae sp. FL0804]